MCHWYFIFFITFILFPFSPAFAQQPENTPLSATEEDEKSEIKQLESFMFNETVVRNRIFTWQIDRYLNMPLIGIIDTAIYDRRIDYSFYKKDVGATYLGVSGSAAITHNYMQRQTHEYMYPLAFFDAYRITPDNIYFYNTRSPFTRFSYNGTLFANRSFEETNLEVLHTQNITPEWNAGLLYRRFGGNGLLTNENTDNRAFTLFTSYSGKRYAAQAGYIYNSIKNKHNGGMRYDSNILDTTMDVRTIEVNLKTANEATVSNSFFLTHSYGIPLNFFRKETDTLRAGEGTVVYFGNTLEYTTAYRKYTDNIPPEDTVAQQYYHNVFYINPTYSSDSIHTSLFDARFFVSIQPFASDFIISKMQGGVGYRYLSNYGFKPDDYLRPVHNAIQHNYFLYANALGSFQRYFSWSAFARYYMMGYYQNDLFLKADATVSFFPAAQDIHLHGSFSIDNRTADYFLHHYYSNHLQWDNQFDKTVETKIQADLDIPGWNTALSLGHSLLNKPVIFNTEAMPEQSRETVSILSATLKYNLQVWLLHLDNRFLIQRTSHPHIVPLPLLSSNTLLYGQVELVKNVLTIQTGADLHFHTKYYAYAYNPAAGAFHLQNERQTGNFPYLDLFLHAKWKRATLYIKYMNLGQNWVNADYFSALHYIMPQRVFKFGISWPFYL